jgi:putative membrane protein
MKVHALALGTMLCSGTVALADAPALNDPQIATVALTAHQVDLDRAKWALSKIKTDEVKQFAEQMANDHLLGKNEVLALAKKLGVKPETSPVSKGLEDGAAKTKTDLQKLKGAAFEKAYIDAEVGYHQAVIDAVNKVLIPGAKNAEVKEALVNTVPTLEGHLQHAKNVQTLLASQK